MTTPTLQRLLGEVGDARHKWQEAQMQLVEARATYDYATKLLTLARDRLFLEIERRGENLDEWYNDPFGDLSGIRHVGRPIGEALRRELRSASGTTEQLVERLQRGGFAFSADAPAREIHAALVKQPWAEKDKKSGEWRLIGK